MMLATCQNLLENVNGLKSFILDWAPLPYGRGPIFSSWAVNHLKHSPFETDAL